MRRWAALAALAILALVGLHFAAALQRRLDRARWRRRCAASRSRRSPGRAGWLVRTALEDRLGNGRGGAPVYRLEVELDDDITGFGIRSDNAVTRERRTLRARYRLVDAGRGTVLLDATAGSDAGVDVVCFRICDGRGRADRARAAVGRGRRADRRRGSRSMRRGRRAAESR